MTACLLALDTSTSRGVLALTRPGLPDLVQRLDPTIQHGRGLLPAIRNLLNEAGLRLADLDGLAVGLGPGSYTGLRIGLTAAKTLAYALHKPMIGLDSLEIVARAAPRESTRVSVIGDAQRGDLYVAEFRRAAPGAPLTRSGVTRVMTFADWAATQSAEGCVLGPATTVERLARQLPAGCQRPGDPLADWPAPEALASLALEVWESGRRDEPWFLEPVYLRRSAAEEQWERRSVGDTVGRP